MPTAQQSIVYLPGLGGGQLGAGTIDQTPDGIVSRLVDALNGRIGRNEYAALGEGRDEEYIEGHKDCTTSVRTINRVVGEKPEPVYQFYLFRYNQNLTRPFDNYGVLWKLVILAGTLLTSIPLAKALFKGGTGKTRAEQFQFVYAGGVLSLLCLYLSILVWALVDQTFTLFQIKVDTLPSSGWPWFDARTQDLARFIGWLAVLLTFVGLTWSSLTTKLTQAATFYLCAMNYLRRGDRRAVLSGQFDKLLAHIDKKNPGGDIHVIAYSFGSVVALDSLFPGADPPKINERVKSLVSIGCPFDMIRTYWPRYFARRASVTALRWINVYSVRDLLGSNFRNDPDAGSPQVGLTVNDHELMPENREYRTDFDAPEAQPDEKDKKRGLWAALLFVGFRVHASYWGAVYEGERTCFSRFSELFLPTAPAPAAPLHPVPPVDSPQRQDGQ